MYRYQVATCGLLQSIYAQKDLPGSGSATRWCNLLPRLALISKLRNTGELGAKLFTYQQHFSVSRKAKTISRAVPSRLETKDSFLHQDGIYSWKRCTSFFQPHHKQESTQWGQVWRERCCAPVLSKEETPIARLKILKGKSWGCLNPLLCFSSFSSSSLRRDFLPWNFI